MTQSWDGDGASIQPHITSPLYLYHIISSMIGNAHSTLIFIPIIYMDSGDPRARERSEKGDPRADRSPEARGGGAGCCQVSVDRASGCGQCGSLCTRMHVGPSPHRFLSHTYDSSHHMSVHPARFSHIPTIPHTNHYAGSNLIPHLLHTSSITCHTA